MFKNCLVTLAVSSLLIILLLGILSSTAIAKQSASHKVSKTAHKALNNIRNAVNNGLDQLNSLATQQSANTTNSTTQSNNDSSTKQLNSICKAVADLGFHDPRCSENGTIGPG